MTAPIARVHRIAIAAALGAAGAATALAVFMTEVAFVSEGGLMFISWAVLAAGAGAGLAGLLTAPLFGRQGPRAAWAAILGALASTVLGALIGGTLMVPGLGTVMGPIVVGLNILGQPLAGAVWIGSMAAVQVHARRLRATPLR